MDKLTEELRILMLEDTPSDAELEEIELRRAGLKYNLMRVESREAFERALAEFKPGIVLADYRLPSYSGRDALEYTRRTHPQIPVIMVTGAIGDETAVELLNLGARDYVLKDRLARLVPSIYRALSEEHGIHNRKLAEGKYRTLFVKTLEGIVIIDRKTEQVSDCNPEFERICGRSLDQLKTVKIWELFSPEKLEAARATLLKVIEGGSANGELELQKPNGTIIPVEFSSTFIDIQDNSIIQAIVRDISERLRAAQALRDSEARYKRITEEITDYQYAVRIENGRAVETRQSPACVTVTGYKAEEFTDNPNLWIQMVVLEDRELVMQRVNQILAGKDVQPIEHRIIRKDGMVRWVSDTIILFKDASGKLLSYDGVIRDITERKNAEDALRRANLALRTLSAANLALVRASNENELLRTVTNVIVETGGYRMAWVGYAEDDAAQNVRPVAQSGYEEGYLDRVNITWADTERGQGPTGTAIREGVTVINQNFMTNPKMAPWREDAIKRGYQSSIAISLSRTKRVLGALTIYSANPLAFGKEEVALLEELASDLAFGIETMRTRLAHEQHATVLRQSLVQSIQAIAGIVEARDPYTAGHQRRVAELATAIAREMGLPEEQVNGIQLAAIIHDLGKIQIPAEILAKPGKISGIEFALIKTHPQAGYDILKDVKFPWPIADIVLQHHEKLDGSGYPQALKDGQMLLAARIMAVADVVEAMSSHRPYRPALGIDAALEEIIRMSGTYYDPQVVDACVKLFQEKKYVIPN